jgi:hypothetical protein
MDPLKQVEQLAARARSEAAPEVEVSAAVLRRLRSAPAEAEAVPSRWLAWAVGSAAAAAVSALALGIELYQLISDPLVAYVYQLQWVML